jgi:glycerophosphoryl diester phosphodiesterase
MRRNNIALILLLILIACGQKRPKLSRDTVILGHGGMGIYSNYPLNSLESVVQCLELGAEGTEIDLQMSKDGVLYAYHDRTLEESTTGEGEIYKENSGKLNGISYNKSKYSSYSLMSVDELLTQVSSYQDKVYFLDCKNFNPDSSRAYARQYAMAIAQIYSEYSVRSSPVIELGNLKIIEELQSIDSTIPIYYYGPIENAIQITDSFNLEGFVSSVSKTKAELVQELKEKNRGVALYNANSKDRNAEAIRLNVDYIQTDKLRDLLKYR